MFSGKGDVPAVGVSLGIERIFMLMEEMGLMPNTPTTTQVLGDDLLRGDALRDPRSGRDPAQGRRTGSGLDTHRQAGQAV